jgi:putative DNA primase/helicase
MRDALACVPADDRDTWVKMGMAIHAELPGDDGYTLFDAWSQRSDTYNPTDVRDVWKSFKPGRVTVGTLYHEAKRHGWQGTPPATTPETVAEREAKAKQRAEQEAHYRARADDAARRAQKLWADAIEPAQSPYLVRKGVQAFGVRSLANGTLLVPVCAASGELVNLQTITEPSPTGPGGKRFLSGGRKQGAWHMLGAPAAAPVLLVAEGYATAASVHMATGRPVAVAFDAGNLKPVAQELASAFPGACIVIAGDDDATTKGNPGRTKAEAAARAVRGLAVFPEGLEPGGTDFNDLHASKGLDVVRAQIEAVCAVQPPALAAPADKAAPPPAPEAGKRPELGDGFKVDDSGVWFDDHDKDGQGRAVFVCSRLDVVAHTRNTDGNEWGYLLAFVDRSHKPRTWAMPARMLAGDGNEYRAALLSMGLTIGPGARAKSLLTLYLQTRDPGELATCTDRTGWHGSANAAAFVLPHDTIQAPPDAAGDLPERVVYQAEATAENPFRQRGSLERWRELVAAPCVGNSRLAFAVASAFAGPLLRWAGLDSGGFHFRGPSSCGKTTALRVAASVYGGASYMQRWRATDNALEAVAAQHCDGLLILDELAQVDPKTAGACAYMLANETSKARSTRTGQARTRLTWRLLFLSAGEIGLAAHMAEGGARARAGQELRMVDIPAEAAPQTIFEALHGAEGGHAFAEQLKRSAEAQHGTAGMAWLRWCVTNAGSLRQRIRQRLDALSAAWVKDGASGQVERVAARFALVATAGELATQAGLTGWPEGEATRAARACFQAWLTARSAGSGDAETAEMLAQVRRWLQLHGAGRCTWWHRAADDRAPDKIHRAGFRQLVGADGQPLTKRSEIPDRMADDLDDYDKQSGSTDYFLFPEVFASEVCEGLDAQAVKRLLLDRQYLVPGKDGCLTVKPRVPGNGTPRLIHLRGTILEGGD